MENKLIRRLVRDTLGCACPDEVLAQIEVHTSVSLDAELTELRTIVVGRRLLIYLWETNDPTRLRSLLPKLIRAGRVQRDREGLNRYRAVIVTDDVNAIGALAKRVFSHLEDCDQKAYLHVIDRREVVDLLA